MNNFSETFISLIRDIERKGSVSQPRDLKVKELIYGQLDIDPTKPFANFVDRKFNWKYFAGELAWYLSFIVCAHILLATRPITAYSGSIPLLKKKDKFGAKSSMCMPLLK